jgi:hypothetical protein
MMRELKFSGMNRYISADSTGVRVPGLVGRMAKAGRVGETLRWLCGKLAARMILLLVLDGGDAAE